MAHAKELMVKETASALRLLHNKSAPHLRPRLKMLQWILKSVHSIDDLSAKVGASRNAIAIWKRTYQKGGLSALLDDKRGGDFRSGIDTAAKKKIAEKLSNPKEAFKSFGEAQDWINKELGMDKQYHAVNKYLKRNFGTKLKVGHKSHVKKDEEAVAFFKNAARNL